MKDQLLLKDMRAYIQRIADVTSAIIEDQKSRQNNSTEGDRTMLHAFAEDLNYQANIFLGNEDPTIKSI